MKLNKVLPLILLLLFSPLRLAAQEPATQSAGSEAAPLPESPEFGNTLQPLPTPNPADTIAEDFTELKDFVITEHQKLVQSDGAKLSYNVSEDPEAGSANILDILRKVPGVTVDAEDNVKVNGQSSFKILMNGHEDPMLKGDLKTALKSIPAASIKKIEVISEPGAKYEAEGVGGILNIVTDRSRNLSGFMTQLSGWLNAFHAGGYFNGRAKFNKVMLDATVNYNNGRVWPRTQRSTRETEDLTGSPNHLLRVDTRLKNPWDYTGARLNMSWEPDTLNLFTFSGYYGLNSWNVRGNEERTMFGTAGDELWRLDRDFDSAGSWSGGGGAASYQHSFLRDDHTLVFSYEFDYGRSRNDASYGAEYQPGAASTAPWTGSRSRGTDRSHIFQLDYANQLSPRHLIEAGAKANLTDTSSDNIPLSGASQDAAAPMPGMEVDMEQFKDIYGLYASYTGTFNSWNVKGGVRYEHTRMGLRYRIGDYDDFTTRLNDIVPNAAVSYNISEASSLRLAYQMRIARPQLQYLNPYVNILNPGQVEYGNPDLKSEKSNDISLVYSNYEGKFTGSAKLSYRYVANSINDILFMKDGVVNSSFANVGRSHTARFDLQGDWNITDDLRWSLFLSGCWEQLKADSELLHAENHGWQWFATTNINYTLPCKLRLSLNGGLFTPWIDLQSRGEKANYYYGLSASKSFLKDDALTVQLSAGNILPTKRSNGYVQRDETLVQRFHVTFSQWNVGLNITWKFGGLKASVKQTAANIEKEETGGGNRGGGGK